MNLIELFEELKINKSHILVFSPEDIMRVEKQVNVEKKINPEIDAKTSENLILALKEYKEELLFVISNRILFNFFTHSNLPKDSFLNYKKTVSDEKIKYFIALFLAEDLISFFSIKLSENTSEKFKKLDALLDLKKYFPEEAIYQMSLLVFSKLDLTLSQLAALNISEPSNIIYIQHKTFYDLLSHFASIELDQKMDSLMTLVVRFHKKKTDNVFFISVIKSMASYNAFGELLNQALVKNRAILVQLEEDKEQDKIYLVVKIIAVILFLLFAFSKIQWF
ncbi:hypothetical protein [Flavobacterium panacagri]|uniref:hypothetical protein n=1 Tax=Flavobacterium panacagri TaxID=3034146 RepID=UPI0025A58A9F|nr:hypothetical protein [Flavobacterium panacagri]